MDASEDGAGAGATMDAGHEAPAVEPTAAPQQLDAKLLASVLLPTQCTRGVWKLQRQDRGPVLLWPWFQPGQGGLLFARRPSAHARSRRVGAEAPAPRTPRAPSLCVCAPACVSDTRPAAVLTRGGPSLPPCCFSRSAGFASAFCASP